MPDIKLRSLGYFYFDHLLSGISLTGPILQGANGVTLFQGYSYNITANILVLYSTIDGPFLGCGDFSISGIIKSSSVVSIYG